MKSLILLSVFVFVAAPITPGQSKHTEVETSYGGCSPNMAHNSGSITINCKNLDPAVAAEISDLVTQLSLLNKKTAAEKNQQSMIKMVREMKAMLRAALAQPAPQGNGPIIQTSTGNCSPNMVGNNNTNVCGPQDLKVDSEQATEIQRLVAEIPADERKVGIHMMVEMSRHQTQAAGRALFESLRAAGLNVDYSESYIVGDSEDNYDGISFTNVTPVSRRFANYMAILLNRVGVVSGPIPTFSATQNQNSPDFVIVVRKP